MHCRMREKMGTRASGSGSSISLEGADKARLAEQKRATESERQQMEAALAQVRRGHGGMRGYLYLSQPADHPFGWLVLAAAGRQACQNRSVRTGRRNRREQAAGRGGAREGRSAGRTLPVQPTSWPQALPTNLPRDLERLSMCAPRLHRLRRNRCNNSPWRSRST